MASKSPKEKAVSPRRKRSEGSGSFDISHATIKEIKAELEKHNVNTDGLKLKKEWVERYDLYSQLSAKKVRELKEEIRRKNIPLKGRLKADHVHALMEYYRYDAMTLHKLRAICKRIKVEPEVTLTPD